MEEENFVPIDLLLDVGNAPFVNLMRIYFAINDLYIEYGGDRVTIDFKDMISEEVPESDFDPLQNTPFKNTRMQIRESEFSVEVPRHEVYETIEKLAFPDMVAEIKRDVDERYPVEVFGDTFPGDAVTNYLYNEHLVNNHRLPFETKDE